MSIVTIVTSQAPDAKPIALSLSLTTDWASLIEVPSYEIPQQSFGGGTDTVSGVAELISPMLVSNKGTTTSSISIRIYREASNTTFTIANEVLMPVNDIVALPLNGQFILSGDMLEAKASIIDSLDITMSYTVGQAEEDDVV
jgi:hypothetical protein